MINSYFYGNMVQKEKLFLTLTSCHISANVTTVSPQISHLRLQSALNLQLNLMDSLKTETQNDDKHHSDCGENTPAVFSKVKWRMYVNRENN